MARVKLTKKKAAEFVAARTKRELSQYELADKLGWPRAKVKRIEKGEVATIDEIDLRQLCRALGVQEPSNVKEPKTKRAGSKKRSKAERKKVVSIFEEGRLFTKVYHLVERNGQSNQVYFEVTMAKEISPDALCRVRSVELLGVTGSINGVENSVAQDPIPAGDRVVIMLWGPGIGVDVGNLNKKKRPGARSSA